MSATFDVIVAGLGAMGSAAACHLARRGERVLGLDRFTPPHAEGSSSGRTRIIREAYFEHPAYVPIVQRAYENWRALERDAGERLLVETGGLMIGLAEGVLVAGALRSAREHGLRHALMGAEDLARRHPALRPGADTLAVWEPRAGVLFPDACIAAHLAQAVKAGAVLRGGEPVTRWSASRDGVEVETPLGRHRARQLVLAGGAWMGELLADLALPLAVRRQTLFWFEPARAPGTFSAGHLPVFIWEHEAGRFVYGFPDFGEGVKLARHGEGEPAEPGRVRREVGPGEVDEMRRDVATLLPDACGRLLAASTCLYTNTPDAHFVLDVHPRHGRVWIASPCSGHGFKFASAIGEILADRVTGIRPRFDLELFRAGRLLT